MARSCAIIPQVKNRNGEVVDSRLFQDLLSSLSNNRAEAVRIYQITKNPEFIKNWNPKLTLDDNDEPTLASLLEKTNLKDKIAESQVLDNLNRQIGYYKRGTNVPAKWKNTDENYRMLVDRAAKFNRTSEYRNKYMADVVPTEAGDYGEKYLNIKVFPRTNELHSLVSKKEYNFQLNERLREILANHGVAVGALTELEKRMGINGVTDFDQAKTAANGLIELIRLAEGIEGEKALPEEFAHFVLEAMSDSPFVNRLINHIHSSGLVAEILGEEYDTYNEMYDGDETRMAKEAAGKLLAKHLLKSEPIENKPYKNLLQRLIASVKEFFKRFDANQIRRAMYQADKEFGGLAREILNGNMDSNINLSNIRDSRAFYQVNERVQRDRKLLQKIIENEDKRLKIYEQRNPNSRFGERQRLLIDRLETNLAENNEIEGIYSFLENALDELAMVDTRLETLLNTPASSINERAKVLRDIRNYLFSYKGIIGDIRKALVDERRYEDNRYGDRVRGALSNVSDLIGDLFIKYNNVAMPLFVDFIRPFTGDSILVPFGKYKGRRFTPEDLIKLAEEDISFFDRWLDSMADSSDSILRIMDQSVKKSRENSRLNTIQIMKRLQAITLKLERAGIKNTDWMFERTKDGKLSGNYISEVNQAEYRRAYREFINKLKEKYGDNPIGEDAEKFRKARIQWVKDNTETRDGRKLPRLSIYGNSVFQNLNAAQKEYYKEVMDIKAELDSYLPDNATTLLSAVKIRKDLLERVKSSSDVKGGLKQIWERVKDEFIRRTDDTDFGFKATIEDFEGHKVQTLPIYFTKLKEGESANDISTDIVSTLTAYASMANDYKEMNKVIDVLELGRDLLREREVVQTQGGKPLVEKFKMLGRTVENKLSKKGEATRFMNRLNDFFDMQVYGKYMEDEGTFGKTNIDRGKLANFINKVTSLNNLALNILSGISNVSTGMVMMNIEAIAGEYFNARNTFNADRIYGANMPAFLGEIGSRVKVSKLALWNELFDTMQEFDQNIKDIDFNRKTWFSRMFGTNTLFFMNNAGEHWMQTRTSLALADAYKMKSPTGQIVSLWDAMEVVPIDSKDRSLGAKLQVKQGYTKADGTEFTRDDVIKFSRRVSAINERMHGIYNKADRSAVQKLAIGRMGMMFRKWMKPSWNRRFKSATYNYDLDSWVEGYYNTSWRFLVQLGKDIREAQFNLGARWDELNPTEKANIRRAITEVSHFLAVAAIIGLIEWSDDKDRPWLVNMLEYQARRLYTEIGTMIPGKPMISEGLKILKSPAAGINTMENLLNLTKLINPLNYMDELESGRYEGHSTAYKTFFDSPVIPMNRTIYRGLHPEEGIPFFKQ